VNRYFAKALEALVCLRNDFFCLRRIEERVSISAPVDGFTVAKPEMLIGSFSSAIGPERNTQTRS
jgi:hypothetical protein